MPYIKQPSIEQHTGLHLPGHNYMGPGTDVARRIFHGHEPVDRDDYISMQHDIDYLAAQNQVDLTKADYKMFADLPFDSHGIIGKTGMLVRTGLGLPMFGGQPDLANILRERAKNFKSYT